MSETANEEITPANHSTDIEAALPPPSLLEYILFPFFILAFLFTLLSFDLIQRIHFIVHPKSIELSFVWFNRFILYSLRVLGTKLSITGQNELPGEGPAIIISNHQSMFDISSIHVAAESLRPKFVAKKELGKGIPGVSKCLRYSGAALIDRNDPLQALPEIERFAKLLKEKKTSGVIFPEGTRARSGTVKSFKKRGPVTLMEAARPIWVIPVTVQNSWKLQARKFGPIPFGVVIEVTIHEPIFLDDTKSAKEVFRHAETVIRST